MPEGRIGQKPDGTWGVVRPSPPTLPVVEPAFVSPWRPTAEDVPLGAKEYLATMRLLARDDLDVITVRKVVNRMIGLPVEVRADLMGFGLDDA